MLCLLTATTFALAIAPVTGAQSPEGATPTALPVGPRLSQPQYRPAPSEDPDADIAAAPGGLDLSGLHDDLIWSDEGRETWIRGRTYKAGAAPEGFAYVPFLGSDAPRTWPVSFRLASASVGGEALALTGSARVRRLGERVLLDRGAVEVTYDVALESVEQSFHLTPPGSGAIVLDVEVETDLAVRPDGVGFRFEGPEGGVLYSGAVAFDESGRRTEVAAALVGDAIRLTVPADFVGEAVGRITVDPVLNTYGLQSATALSYGETDIAYDATSALFLVGIEENFAMGDTDIALVSHDVSGNVIGAMAGFFALDDMQGVSVANQNADDVCLVVSTRASSSPVPDQNVVGRLIDMPTGVAGPGFTIAGALDDEFNADVGGNGSTNPNGRFLVVWTRETGPSRFQTYMRYVEADGTRGPEFLLDPQPTEDQLVPAISKSVGDAADVNFWTVVSVSAPIAGGQASIICIQVNANGTTALAPAGQLRSFPVGVLPLPLDVSTALLLPDPTGTTTTPTYLVSYDEIGGDGEAQIIVAQGTDARITQSLNRIEHADVDLTQGAATFAVTRDDYVVAYHEENAAGTSVSTYATTLDVIEGAVIAINERRLVLQSGALGVNSAVGLASRYESGLTGSSWVGAAWSENGVSWSIEGARIGVDFRTSIGAQYCYGQPNSTGERGFLGIYGDRGTSTTKTAQGSGMPPLQFCLLGTGTLPAQVNPVPNSEGTLCIAGAVGRFNAQITQIATDGTATVTVDPQMIPGPSSFVAAMAGETRGFQFWHRDVSASGAPTSNFTNGAAVTFR